MCQNHIVWDAVEVVEFTRKHTAGVARSSTDIRRAIEPLVASRDERRDGFVKVMRKAMREKLGDDAEAVLKELAKNGIRGSSPRRRSRSPSNKGRFTIFGLVDALTRLAGRLVNAGDRVEIDAKAASCWRWQPDSRCSETDPPPDACLSLMSRAFYQYQLGVRRLLRDRG